MPVNISGNLSGPTARLTTVLAFVLACLVFFGYLWAQAGGSVPGLASGRDYRVSVQVDNVGNVVPFSDVMMAGVPVGKVDELTRDGNLVTLALSFDPAVVPLHGGLTLQITEKSLAGQPFVRVVDGAGPAIPNGQHLPASVVVPPVTVRDVLASLDPATLDSLGSVVRSLGTATDGRSRDISALMDGLAALGRNGDTAIDAVAAQSADLETLSSELDDVFDALDTGQGQIADLVSNANAITIATATQKESIEATLRKLPPALQGIDSTATQLDRISTSLGPIAADLRTAAPDLNTALVALPETAADLRGLLPPLEGVLDQAPDTFDRIPDLGEATRDLIPPATVLLKDLNPGLRYIKPYGPEIAQLFTNFGASFHHYGPDGGSYVYLRPIFTAKTLRPNPVKIPEGTPLETMFNPYPEPGGLADLRPFTGDFPRIERDD